MVKKGEKNTTAEEFDKNGSRNNVSSLTLESARSTAVHFNNEGRPKDGVFARLRMYRRASPRQKQARTL